jgi:hypothetical protein
LGQNPILPTGPEEHQHFARPPRPRMCETASYDVLQSPILLRSSLSPPFISAAHHRRTWISTSRPPPWEVSDFQFARPLRRLAAGRGRQPHRTGCQGDWAVIGDLSSPGMKTDRIRTDITHIIFVFIFLFGFGFGHG